MKNAIGIIGGVGPTAGADLALKVFRHTKAENDQEHIDLYLTSCPSIIPDRTDFLLNGGADPVYGIQKCVDKLCMCGANLIGISCNTAHSHKIIDRLNIPQNVKFINMISSTCDYIDNLYADSSSVMVGLLGTLGTIRTAIYDEYFKMHERLNLTVPDADICSSVHSAIYDRTYGIKATPAVSEKAEKAVTDALDSLKERNCRAVILGCTELPLVFPRVTEYRGMVLIDPTDILAVELVKAADMSKLI